MNKTTSAMPNNRVTWKDLDLQELRHLYVDQRRSPAEIGHLYGYGRQTTLNALAYHEMPTRKSRRLKLNENEVRELMLLHVICDLTLVSLARKFGVSVTTVSRYIRTHLPPRKKRSPGLELSVVELVDQYEQGLRLFYVDWNWSLYLTAKQFECNVDTIRDALQQLGIAVREGSIINAAEGSQANHDNEK